MGLTVPFRLALVGPTPVAGKVVTVGAKGWVVNATSSPETTPRLLLAANRK